MCSREGETAVTELAERDVTRLFCFFLNFVANSAVRTFSNSVYAYFSLRKFDVNFAQNKCQHQRQQQQQNNEEEPHTATHIFFQNKYQNEREINMTIIRQQHNTIVLTYIYIHISRAHE